MQTFLPHESYLRTAEVLDRQRLGKQRVENLQILKCLLEQPTKWANHPAVLMWKGYERDLMRYQRIICEEWTSRGYKDTCLEKSELIVAAANLPEQDSPWWLGLPSLHASHRSNLLRKDPTFYGRFRWTEGPELEYVWPSKLRTVSTQVLRPAP